MSNTTPQRDNTRRHDLDALRACAMLLGIALHASVAYMGNNWAVEDPSSSRAFVWLSDGIHGFRMQLFFLLSGFFTALLVKKRGISALLQHRFKRVFLPLLIFTPLLLPLIEFILTTARRQQGTLARFSPAEGTPLWQSFNFHHLWFLWFLCLFVLCYAAYKALVPFQLPRKCLTSPYRLLWLLPLTMLPQAFMIASYPTFGPDSSLGLIPQPAVFFYYAIFYAVGAGLFHSGDAEISKHWKRNLTIALILLPAAVFVEKLNFSHYGHIKPLSDLLQVSYSWLMIFASIGFFKEKFHHPSARMRYLSDASYWLYLAHLPLVFGLHLLARDLPFSCWIKFPLVTVTTFIILLASYHFLVRHKPLGKLLNGK